MAREREKENSVLSVRLEDDEDDDKETTTRCFLAVKPPDPNLINRGHFSVQPFY